MDDTPHHLSNNTAETPPPLTSGNLNPSHYYIVQISEYEAMEAEIERLRAAGDALIAAIRNHDLREQHIKAWEARRG